MALSTQPYKGARDFYPPDKRFQKFMFSVMRKTAERYGYEEYDAPILEPLEIYTAKTGDEIVNDQTYTFEDRGGRKVTIRPEMTPTVSRMVAGKRQELAYPLRWYSIPNLWRYERPQAGRLREHWQLNVDIFGIEELDAELEVIQISHEILKNLGATDETFNIRLNTRKLTNYVLADHLGLDDATTHSASKLMDRMHKMERSEFVKLLKEVMPPGKADELVKLLSVKELSELPDSIKSQEPAKRLSALLDLLKKSGITNASYDPTLIRGFDYYTDIVFEVFDNHPDNNRSMFGGGRYDGLVGMFGVEPVPTVGFGMGDVTLQKFIELHDLMPPIGTETDLYVVLIDEVSDHARKVIADFRQMGINVAVDWESQKADKAIKSAVKKQIPFCLFIGAREIQDEQYTLKDLATTKEEHGSVEYLSKVIKAKKAGSRYLHITG